VRHLIAALCAAVMAGPALAFVPQDGALGFQPAATRIAERIHIFHHFVLIIIVLITLLVLGLLMWVILRHNRKANPVPKKFSHNTLIEIIWTVVPALILVAIASQSFPNLYYQDVVPNLQQITDKSDAMIADGKTAQHERFAKDYFPEAAEKGFVNVKAQGNQWNWTYTYPDLIDDSGYPLEFVSNPVHVGVSTDGDNYAAATGRTDFASKPKNLAVDYPMVIPEDRFVRYYTAAADVIHSWTVPAFGVKTDAVPGRLNEGWFLVEEPGIYYGQCSELCGVNHAFMPIEVRVVSQAQFDSWAEFMLAGDYEAAYATVDVFASTEQATQFAAKQ